MSVEITYKAIQSVALVAQAIPLADAVAVVEEMERTDALMPLLDPTGWIKLQKTAPQHARLARAFLAFRRELAELIEVAP